MFKEAGEMKEKIKEFIKLINKHPLTVFVVVMLLTNVILLVAPKNKTNSNSIVATIKSMEIIPRDYMGYPSVAIKVITEQSVPCGNDGNETNIFYNYFNGAGYLRLLYPKAYPDKNWEMEIFSAEQLKGKCILTAVKVKEIK